MANLLLPACVDGRIGVAAEGAGQAGFGVSDDEQALDAAAALDADERQARPRQFETDT